MLSIRLAAAGVIFGLRLRLRLWCLLRKVGNGLRRGILLFGKQKRGVDVSMACDTLRKKCKTDVSCDEVPCADVIGRS